MAGRYGRAALGLALAALLVTGLYFPHRYWAFVDLETAPVALVLVRDALLIALVAACWPRPHIGERARRRTARPPARGRREPRRARRRGPLPDRLNVARAGRRLELVKPPVRCGSICPNGGCPGTAPRLQLLP